MTNIEIYARVSELIKDVDTKSSTITPDTTFQHDLELDSLTVMDFVAELEDEFDIIIPLNLLPELETVQQVTDAVEKIMSKS